MSDPGKEPVAHRRLRVLFGEVEQRCAETRAQVRNWPCEEGCDHCCRHLARDPQLTEAEWQLLRSGLRALPPGVARDTIHARLAAWPAQRDSEASGPVSCPLLDRERGACSVYPVRPAACRSYGFYRAGQHDAWCGAVTEHVAHADIDLVFGNQDALERKLVREQGEARGLAEWVSEQWPPGENA